MNTKPLLHIWKLLETDALTQVSTVRLLSALKITRPNLKIAQKEAGTEDALISNIKCTKVCCVFLSDSSQNILWSLIPNFVLMFSNKIMFL